MGNFIAKFEKEVSLFKMARAWKSHPAQVQLLNSNIVKAY